MGYCYVRTAGSEASRRSRGRGSVGRASPCQGEGRGFESRRPLGGADRRPRAPRPLAEWPSGLGKGLQSPVRGFDSRLRLDPGSRALSSAGERFPDTEEVTGSIPVAPTRPDRGVCLRVSALSVVSGPVDGNPDGNVTPDSSPPASTVPSLLRATLIS